MMKYFPIILLILLSVISCEADTTTDPAYKPFDIDFINNTEAIIYMKTAFWDFSPDPPPAGTYQEELNSIYVFPVNTDPGITYRQHLIGHGIGDNTIPNEGLRYNIAGIEFLNADGDIILSYYDINTPLLTDNGAGDWVNIWETPPESGDNRPFYLELDEDGVTGRIIIIKEPAAP